MSILGNTALPLQQEQALGAVGVGISLILLIYTHQPECPLVFSWYVVPSRQCFEHITSLPKSSALLYWYVLQTPCERLAAYLVQIYDWFLTVESELAFIWSPKWNLGTLLYFLTRYPAFVDTAILFYISTGYYNTLSPPVRPLLWGVSGWVFLLGIVVAEAIMAICVWAMWGRGRRMAIFLTILVLIVAGVSTIAPAEPPAAAKYISLPNTSFQSIIIAETSRASISLAALTLLQVILFFLVLSKAVQYSRNRCSNFVFGCFQHGLLYYVVLVGEHIAGPSLITADVLLPVLSVTNLAIILTVRMPTSHVDHQQRNHL
ncbi:hypothetical protein BD779DRAFT_1635113 [Infundibulicybe gibba]|nr:hypothetical protein BD779DRAFT_1635113 [Infundibulicybe gibba]